MHCLVLLGHFLEHWNYQQWYMIINTEKSKSGETAPTCPPPCGRSWSIPDLAALDGEIRSRRVQQWRTTFRPKESVQISSSPYPLGAPFVRWRDTKTPMMSLLLPACRLAAYYYCLFFHCYCSTAADIVTRRELFRIRCFDTIWYIIIIIIDIMWSEKPIECVALE